MRRRFGDTRHGAEVRVLCGTLSSVGLGWRVVQIAAANIKLPFPEPSTVVMCRTCFRGIRLCPTIPKPAKPTASLAFGDIANKTSQAAGRASTFTLASAVVVIWAVTGPSF